VVERPTGFLRANEPAYIFVLAAIPHRKLLSHAAASSNAEARGEHAAPLLSQKKPRRQAGLSFTQHCTPHLG
jgi:hypothetical protein